MVIELTSRNHREARLSGISHRALPPRSATVKKQPSGISHYALLSSHKTAEIIEKRDHREAVTSCNIEERDIAHHLLGMTVK